MLNIGTWLQRRAAQTPDAPALFVGAKCVANYRGFAREARAFAHGLIEQGIAPGDRIAIYLNNAPDNLIILYGIWFAGAVAVPINAKLHQKEVVWILEDAGAALIIAEPAMAQGLEKLSLPISVVDVKSVKFRKLRAGGLIDACMPRKPEDLAWLFYTSGTTGQPKGVMISHRMLVNMSLCYLSDVDSVTEKDTAFYAAPLSHGAGLYNMVHVLKGARHVFPKSGGFEPLEVFETAKHFGSLHMFMAPTMVKRLTKAAIEHTYSGKGLRSIIYAGGPMYQADIIDAVDQFGDVFVQIYGQGECPMGITALPRGDVSDRSHDNWRARLASVGLAQSGVEIQISSDAGDALPMGEIGEICVRGDTVMTGYWNNPSATASTIVNGWLQTGDMGFIDGEGYVTLVDRSKDVIISGGSNIYPREVEEVLLAHPDVSEVSVIGRAHLEWGEEVIAFVVPNAGKSLKTNALDAHCLDNIARFKRPKHYVEIASIPKNNYGKVLKTELRTLLETKHAGGAHSD